MYYGHFYWFSLRHRIADPPLHQIVDRQPGLLPIMRKFPERVLQPQQGYEFRVTAGAGAWLTGIALDSVSLDVVIQIQDRTSEQLLFDEYIELANRTIAVGSGAINVSGCQYLLPQPKLLSGSGVLNVSVRNQAASTRTIIGALELLEP